MTDPILLNWHRWRIRHELENRALAMHVMTVNSSTGLIESSLDVLAAAGFDRAQELAEAKRWVKENRGYET